MFLPEIGEGVVAPCLPEIGEELLLPWELSGLWAEGELLLASRLPPPGSPGPLSSGSSAALPRFPSRSCCACANKDNICNNELNGSKEMSS